MSTEKGNKIVTPIVKPNIGKIHQNSQDIPKTTTKQPTQTPPKKGK